MTDTRKTLIFGGAAVVLVALALLTTPHQVTPSAFSDEGEQFFPDFKDPNTARTLEVIKFDKDTGSAVPFKVTFDDGRWVIPSHYDYPADAKDRLAKTAAGLIGITKDDFRTDNPSDFAACGVIDPLDDTNPSLEGRGERVTIKGENDKVLADLIVGKSYKGRDNFRLVRVPGSKRVYGTKLDLDISTKFNDWIDKDLMQIDKDEIDEIVLRNYRINERTGTLDDRSTVTLTKKGDAWTAKPLVKGEEVNSSTMYSLVKAIDELSIAGVRPKPKGLTASLSKGSGDSKITNEDMLSLQAAGFYFTREGHLVSNEGELQVGTSDGVDYTLRFGEVASGTDAESADAKGGHGDESVKPSRYLMITTTFDPSKLPEPAKPANTDFKTKPDSLWTKEDYDNKGKQTQWQRWKDKVDSGRKRSQELNERFAHWYYVISSDSFDKLHLSSKDVFRKTPKSS